MVWCLDLFNAVQREPFRRPLNNNIARLFSAVLSSRLLRYNVLVPPGANGIFLHITPLGRTIVNTFTTHCIIRDKTRIIGVLHWLSNEQIVRKLVFFQRNQVGIITICNH